MKRLLAFLSICIGISATATAATLTITPTKSTYEVGEVMVFLIKGETGPGEKDNSINGNLLILRPGAVLGVGAIQSQLSSGNVPWPPLLQPLACDATTVPPTGGIFTCQVFNQTWPGDPVEIDGPLFATVFMLAGAGSQGPFTLVWNSNPDPFPGGNIPGDTDFFDIFPGSTNPPNGPGAPTVTVNIVLPPAQVAVDIKPSPIEVFATGVMTDVPGGSLDPAIEVGSTFSATYKIDPANVTGSAPGVGGGTDYFSSPSIEGSLEVEGFTFPIELNAVVNIANDGPGDSWSTSLTGSSGNYALSFVDDTATALDDESFVVATELSDWTSGEVLIAGAGATAVGAIDLLQLQPEFNSINLNNPSKRIPVAILGSAVFDVTQIDTSTVAFGPGMASLVHAGGHLEDVNADGFTDLLGHFTAGDTGLVTGDTEGCVTGNLLDTSQFEGCDSVATDFKFNVGI